MVGYFFLSKRSLIVGPRVDVNYRGSAGYGREYRLVDDIGGTTLLNLG